MAKTGHLHQKYWRNVPFADAASRLLTADFTHAKPTRKAQDSLQIRCKSLTPLCNECPNDATIVPSILVVSRSVVTYCKDRPALGIVAVPVCFCQYSKMAKGPPVSLVGCPMTAIFLTRSVDGKRGSA